MFNKIFLRIFYGVLCGFISYISGYVWMDLFLIDKKTNSYQILLLVYAMLGFIVGLIG